MSRTQNFWNSQAEWSRATFGADHERDHIGPLKHLAKEAVEAQVQPADPVEIADCLFLVFDAARRAGLTLDELLTVAERKLEINKARQWAKPGAAGEPVEHVRTAELPAPAHAFEVRISIGGNTWHYVQRTFEELVERYGALGCREGLASGGWDGCHSVDIRRREITPEEYREELEKWREGLRANLKNGASAE